MDTQSREVWRDKMVAELLKASLIYGKKSIDELIADVKKIEEYVFSQH